VKFIFKLNIIWQNLVGLLFATLFSFAPAHTGNSTETDFRSYDPDSKIRINYEGWTSLLKATVVKARMSSRLYAHKPQANIGARINFANPNPTRLEASRVLYSYLTEKDIDYVHKLRLAMEALPQAIDFRTLNRGEQLAYWLNLYNVTVYEQIAKRYPIRKLKKLHMDNPSLWDEKILHINGTPLSLNDIQYNIIEKIWHNPLILYGLYQGAIGGPNLRKKAYTGKNVYDQLEYNAEEFVNSLRGLRFRGKDVLVSVIYQWNRNFFPDFELDLRRHLRKYTNFELTARLDSSRKIKAEVYDWYTAGVINHGTSLPGGSESTNPVAMIMQAGGRNLPHTGKAWDTAVAKLRFRNNAAFFLKDFLKYNNKNAKTRITIEEIDKTNLQKKNH